MSSLQANKESKIFNNQWILKKKVSSGSFGVVFIGMDKNTKEFVAIKLEKEDNEDIRSLDREVQILTRLQGLSNVPKLYWSGQENNYNIMVLNLLGRDLAYYMKALKKFSLKTVLMLMDQLITVLENVHNRSIIHRDLKPENILMGRENEAHMVYIIDYGISKIYRDNSGRHITFKDNKPFIGTTRYASIAAHQGHELGRKDDLESLGYVMIFLLKGHLPWQNLQNVTDKDKTQVVGDIKAKTKSTDLCKDLPNEFVKYLDYVKKLHFKSQPDYKYLKNMFQKLGQQNNVRYNENDWDWSEHNQTKEGKSSDSKNNLNAIDGQEVQRSGVKKLSFTPIWSIGQIDSGYLAPPEAGNGQRNQKRNLSLTPSVRSTIRKSTGGSFMGTYSSINIKYVPTNIHKQGGSQIMGSKFDVDDEKSNVKPIAEENKELDETTQTGFVEQEMDEYAGNAQTLDKKLQKLLNTQVKAQFNKRKIPV
ncbi:hypothetical protein ABPG72_000466 [Tetrahymena utriculariae]